jgi:hypothetical protein
MSRKLIATSQYRNHTQRSEDRTLSDQFLELREDSDRPLTVIDPCNYADPVYNIAIQNPTAQPGYGAAQVPNHRYDVGDIYGIMDRTPTTPVVPMKSLKTRSYTNFSSEFDTASENKQYFNAGTRAEGAGLNVYPMPHGDAHLVIARKMPHSHTDTRTRERSFFLRNSIVYPNTALRPCATPVGSKVDDSDKFVAPPEVPVFPPKMMATTLDNKVFVNY